MLIFQILINLRREEGHTNYYKMLVMTTFVSVWLAVLQYLTI